jgi:hypothetical protein
LDGFERVVSLAGDAAGWITQPAQYGVALLSLALVFLWSGTAKLRRPALAAMAMIDLRILRRATPAHGVAAATVELAVAAALTTAVVLPGVAWPAAALAAVLLWWFVALQARGLRSGESLSCFCFGNSTSELSRATLGRTAALAALATVLALGAPEQQAPGASQFSLQLVVAAGLLGAATVLGMVPQLLRLNRDPLGLADERWVRRVS